MDTALEQPVIVEKSRTRSPSPKETRRVRKTSTDSENDSSRRKSFKQRKISPSNERSEEIHRRSKSKKKQKASYFVFRKKKCAQFLSFYYWVTSWDTEFALFLFYFSTDPTHSSISKNSFLKDKNVFLGFVQFGWGIGQV